MKNTLIVLNYQREIPLLCRQSCTMPIRFLKGYSTSRRKCTTTIEVAAMRIN